MNDEKGKSIRSERKFNLAEHEEMNDRTLICFDGMTLFEWGDYVDIFRAKDELIKHEWGVVKTSSILRGNKKKFQNYVLPKVRKEVDLPWYNEPRELSRYRHRMRKLKIREKRKYVLKCYVARLPYILVFLADVVSFLNELSSACFSTYLEKRWSVAIDFHFNESKLV